MKALIALVVSLSMLTGFLVIVPEKASAMPSDAWIQGVVTDGVDPIPNTYVKVMLFTAGNVDVNHTYTDVDGEYVVGVPGGFDYMVFAANGSFYMELVATSVMVGEATWVNFTLETISPLTTSVTIKGFVTDDVGTPFPDCTVLGVAYDPMGGDIPIYANATEPEPDGYFEITTIESTGGGGAIAMDIPGYPMIENSTDSPIVGGETYWFNITIEPLEYADDATIYGSVTDFDTGLPIPNVLVTAEVWNEFMEGDRYSNYTFTETDGSYELNIVNGSARVMISKGGYMMKMYEEVMISESEMYNLDAALAPTTCTVKGNVTDLTTDDPITFANVFVTDGTDNITISMTDDDGYYEIRSIDGSELFMVAQAEGYSSNWTTVSLSPGDQLWQDFGLWPVNSWLEGYVTDKFSGDPIEGAWISADSPLYHEWGETDATGYYNLSLVWGEYWVDIGAMDYRSNQSTVVVPDGATVTHDVELLPWDLPQDCMMYGWVNDTDSGTGIDGAMVKVQLSDHSFYNDTWTEADGYYEMMVPKLELMYGVTAYQHSAEFGAIDATGQTEVRLDVVLDPDYYGPNVTYSQSPVDNVTWFNPTVIDIEVEEPNLQNMMLMQFMHWMTNDTWEYFYALDMKSTSFDPFDSSDSLPYLQLGDVYYVHEEWNATAVAGHVSDGVDEAYVMAYEQWWGMDHLLVIRGYFTDVTYIHLGCAAYFDYDTGELVMIYSDWGFPVELDDPAAVFEPGIMELSYDTQDYWSTVNIYYTELDPLSVPDLSFQYDPIVPSAMYVTLFGTGDFGDHGTGMLTNFTVDNDPPVADAGPDQIVVINTTATLDGTGSSDVSWEPGGGIVEYAWDFEYDAGLVHLVGDEVTFFFDLVGLYAVNLTVTDGAGHYDVDMLWIEVVLDAPPVANAGPDMSVPEDVPAVFDGGNSSDDIGIVNYTWTVVDLSVEMYGVSPDYTFDEPGTYTIELVVTDTIDQVSDPDTMVLTVLDTTDPVADAGADQEIMLGEEVTFDGSDSTDNVEVVEWTWTIDLGDDTEILTGEVVDYEFMAAGEFLVTLTVADDAGNEDEDTMTVTVIDDEDPVADAGPDPTGVVVGATVILNGSESSDNSGVIASYVWTFVDGTAQELEGMVVEYVFEDEGEFEITLTVTDPSGNNDTDIVVVRVGPANEAPNAVIADSPVIIVKEGDTVQLDGSGSTDDHDAIDSYVWTITENGEVLATLTGVTAEYEFDTAGEYIVTLNVTDEEGLSDEATLQVVVEEKSSILTDYWWLLATLAAVVVIVALVALLRPGKGGPKGKESPPEDDEEEMFEDELPPPDDEDI